MRLKYIIPEQACMTRRSQKCDKYIYICIKKYDKHLYKTINEIEISHWSKHAWWDDRTNVINIYIMYQQIWETLL